MADGRKKVVGKAKDVETQQGRRRALKIGAMLVPTIVTLHATPAWAQNIYETVAYRYGTNAGLCKNPDFNPNASSNSPNGQEFIQCPDSGTAHDAWSEEQSTGPVDF